MTEEKESGTEEKEYMSKGQNDQSIKSEDQFWTNS